MPSIHLKSPRPYVLSFPDNDYIGKRVLRTGRAYEPQLLNAGRGLARSGKVIDIGANIGNHAIYWAMGGATVVAYEPNPDALSWLRQNVAANGLEGRVLIRPVAVGANSGTAGIVGTIEGNLGGTAFAADTAGDIEMVQLDDELLGDVRVLKIDVEGGELEVLAGAERFLASARPFVVMESFTPGGRAAMRTLGYRRLPVPFARATYLYGFGVTGALRAALTPLVVANAARLAVSYLRIGLRSR